MASGCIRGGLDWILGKTLHQKSCKALQQAVQESGGVTIPGGVLKIDRYGPSGHGLAGIVVMG